MFRQRALPASWRWLIRRQNDAARLIDDVERPLGEQPPPFFQMRKGELGGVLKVVKPLR